MKTYTKTKWVDNETPVNAANLNKIENAIQEITETVISPSDLIPGDGIKINTTCGKVEISTTVENNLIVCSSEDYRSLGVVETDKVYMVIDHLNPKSVKFIYNSNTYHPQTISSQITMENGMGLEEYLMKDYNTLVDKINELEKRLNKLENGTETV